MVIRPKPEPTAGRRELSRRQKSTLAAMDIALWQLRAGTPPSVSKAAAARTADPLSAPAESSVPADSRVPAWEVLEAEALRCMRCALHESRTQVVFGTGDRNAVWMVIGEAPGAEEDRLGQPFVGRAGQLLNEMLRAVGLSREAVYIANILKCRPPQNRDPAPSEAASCAPFLTNQIALVQPRIVVAVGRIAAQNLLGVDSPLAKLRGQVHRHPATGTPVVVTYHPAYLLRSPAEKRKAWADLLLARRTAGS